MSYKLNQQNQLLMSTPTKASNEAQKSPIEISAPIGTSVKVNTNSEETADQIQDKFEPLKTDLEESKNAVKEIESQVNQLKNDIITSSELEDLKSEILEAITIQQEKEARTEPPSVKPTVFPIIVPIYTTTTTTPKPVRTLHQHYYQDFEPQASSQAIQVIQPPEHQAAIINRPTKYKANRPLKRFKSFPTPFPLKQFWYRRKYRHICLFLFCMKDFKVHGKGHSNLT